MNHLLIIFVIAIVILQVFLFIKTGKLISRLKEVLSGNFSTATTLAENVTVIKYQSDHKDKVTENIERSINTYLRKNKGAVSDFNLIKDIVERNCDSLEAEITSQTPLPLYLGLMGTVAGIILGLFTINMNGGFAKIDKVIEILMSEVAIAMIASFMGIGFTTLSLWKSKQCKVTVETNKNRFYTWIQTNLLPVISKSAVSAITLLQKNLTRFNESFTGTIDRLESKLGDVGDMYFSQIEILEKIEAIDVKKMATANVKILSALDDSMGSLERFSRYMSSVNDCLNAVKDLNGKLDEHLERTEALGVVSDFYKSQMREISLRQDAIKSAVISVDDVMKSALGSLKTNSENGLKSMQETFVNQIMTMQQIINKQTEQMTSKLNQLPELMTRLSEISTIPSKINRLLEGIEKSNGNLVKQISQSIRLYSAHTYEGVTKNVKSDTPVIDAEKKLMRWLTTGILGVIAIVLIGILTVNILTYNSTGRSTESITTTTPIPSETTDFDIEKVSKNTDKDHDIPQIGLRPEKIESTKAVNESESLNHHTKALKDSAQRKFRKDN